MPHKSSEFRLTENKNLNRLLLRRAPKRYLIPIKMKIKYTYLITLVLKLLSPNDRVKTKSRRNPCLIKCSNLLLFKCIGTYRLQYKQQQILGQVFMVKMRIVIIWML